MAATEITVPEERSIGGRAGGMLPAGWEAKTDQLGAEYYWNQRMHTASWSVPTPEAPGKALPRGWKSYMDNAGRTYYYNERDRKTTWSTPNGSPVPSPKFAPKLAPKTPNPGPMPVAGERGLQSPGSPGRLGEDSTGSLFSAQV